MAEPEKPYSILAIGAHMDDCWLGMGGTALKAVRKGHKVTMVTAISNYRYLPYLAGRSAELKPALEKFHAERGIQTISLNHDYMRLHNDPALVHEITQIVNDVKADVVFIHAEDECNFDHTALGAASRTAAIHGGCFLETEASEKFKYCGEIYQYTTGWQATDFRPDTYVEIGDVIFDLLASCNFFDDTYAKGRGPKHLTITDHDQNDRTLALTGHARYKFAQSISNSMGSGYAEAFKAYTRLPIGYRRLARL